jgi:hypothetical protein
MTTGRMAHAAFIALWLAVLDPAPPATDSESFDAQESPRKAGKRIDGRVMASLVELDALTITYEADVLPGEQPDTIDAIFDVAVDVSHRFDGTIRELELGVAILPREHVEFAWTRLHTPPLRLTTAEVERKMPLPIAVLTLQGDELAVTNEDDRHMTSREAYPDLPMPADGALGSLLAVGGYTLEGPSERDVLRILEDGGPADLAALANWASLVASDETLVFDDAGRSRIMAMVAAQIRSLRAPPAFGDFQRLNALTALARACAAGDDLEQLLTLVRPMTILLSAAQVSYDSAASEEAALGISVHGFRRLQSRSDSALAWEATLRHLRASALDRLVRLAYEPDDFPDAPTALRRSPLQVQASQLLLPLTTTDVARALAVAAERPQTQRDLLRFWVEVRHAGVVEPLVEWLAEQPGHVDDVGIPALDVLGDRMLPVLMRRFDDREAPPTERAVVWRLLASLPERHAAELTELSRSMGIDVDARRSGATPTFVEVLAALREHDEKVRIDRIDVLVVDVGRAASTITELRARVRAADLLAATSPSHAEAAADAIITAHVEAARAFDIEFPMERRSALRRLGELPLGSRRADAARASVVVDAELAAARGEATAALDALERFDPALEHPDVRAAYVGALMREWDLLVAASDWDALDALLARAELTVAQDFDVATHRAEIEQHRRRPKIVLAIVVGTALACLFLIALHVLGVFARIAVIARRFRRARAAPPDDHDDAGADADDAGDDAEAHDGDDRANDDSTNDNPNESPNDHPNDGPNEDYLRKDDGADARSGGASWTTDGGSPLDDVAA